MGFFSGLLGAKKTTVPGTGFYATPQYVQGAINQAGQQIANQGVGAFTPLPQTASETQAFNLMQPLDAAGVQQAVSPYLNPFTDYLTKNINDQAEGQYSLYKQALANSGQMGSNREFLNAAAADNARLNAIGTTLAGNYNNAQNTALGQRQQDITNLLAQGGFQRDLNAQTQQAPMDYLQALQQLMATYQGQPSQVVKSGGGLGGLLDLAGKGASLYTALSDPALKEESSFYLLVC